MFQTRASGGRKRLAEIVKYRLPIGSLFVAVLGILSSRSGASALERCNKTATYCPSRQQCCVAPYSPTGFGCRGNSACCKPGPPLEPSVKELNCLVLGDSVSIGYTPMAAMQLQDVCQLQHSPYDVSDGGAADTAYGLDCLYSFLRTQRQTPVVWDVILFNFGLHNLDPKATHIYQRELKEITRQLVASNKTRKLLFATTTPYMKDALQNITIVEDLNSIARDIMNYHGIPVVDLYQVVTNHCGDLYVDCDWCNQQPCDLHYNSKGYAALASKVAPAIRLALS